jgi:hypothetical protein
VAAGSKFRLTWGDDEYSIGNLNSLPTQTSERLMSVLMTGAEFHAYLHSWRPSAATQIESRSLWKRDNDLLAKTWKRSVRMGSWLPPEAT